MKSPGPKYLRPDEAFTFLSWTDAIEKMVQQKAPVSVFLESVIEALFGLKKALLQHHSWSTKIADEVSIGETVIGREFKDDVPYPESIHKMRENSAPDTKRIKMTRLLNPGFGWPEDMWSPEHAILQQTESLKATMSSFLVFSDTLMEVLQNLRDQTNEITVKMDKDGKEVWPFEQARTLKRFLNSLLRNFLDSKPGNQRSEGSNPVARSGRSLDRKPEDSTKEAQLRSTISRLRSRISLISSRRRTVK